MHCLAPDGAGDDLHGPCGIVAPGAGLDAQAAAVAGGEKRCMPAEEAFGRQRLGKALGGIQHHIHHTVRMAVGGGQRTDVHAQAARDGRAHGLTAERLAFDGAGGDDLLRQRLQGGLGAVDFGQGGGQRGGIEPPLRPAGALPEVRAAAGLFLTTCGDYAAHPPQ